MRAPSGDEHAKDDGRSAAEATWVDARPSLTGIQVGTPLAVGSDGVAVAAHSDARGDLELWRLSPESVDDALRRRLAALQSLELPQLMRIVALDLDAPIPWVLTEGGERGSFDPWGASGQALRDELAGLAAALGAAHRLDVVHGGLDANALLTGTDGRARLDMTGLRMRPQIGEPRVAPEVMVEGAAAPSDVWALATILAEAPAADAIATELAAMRDEDPERRVRAIDLGREPPDEPLTDAERFGFPPQLGAYELGAQIGAGGMGRVFRARDIAGGPDVAVKVLLPTWARYRALVARFRREARVLRQLQSPYVARFVAVNEDAGFHYLVMELVEGRTAEALAEERGPLDVPAALSIGCDVARALAELHSLGLVHRDVKPDNILIDERTDPPRIKLCDFGIARPMEPGAADALTRHETPGTPAYMAPEQIMGERTDARADVYALGATVYRLLAGQPPFVGPAHAVLIAHTTMDPPPLEELAPSVPVGVRDVIMRCLAKGPESRYADGAAALDALAAAGRGAATTEEALPQALGVRGAPRVFDFAWSLRADPRELWPYVSNTERLNRAAGLDEVEWSHVPGEGYVRTEGSFRAAGLELRWRENPFEWIAPRRLGVVREYSAGPFEWMRSRVELAPSSGGGTELRHCIEIKPRGLLGEAAAAMEVGIRLRRGLARVYRRIDAACVLAREGSSPLDRGDAFEAPAATSAVLVAQIDDRAKAVLQRGGNAEVLEVLSEHLRSAPAPVLARIRPRAWARANALPEEATLRTLLLAASEGLLELRWDILCPLCRVPSQIEDTLRALESHGRCEVCDLDFTLDLARSVELVLRAHPGLREADTGVYCIGGPAHSPHVVAQVRLPPGERFALEVDLSRGRYAVTGRGLPQRWPFGVHEGARSDGWDLSLREGAAPDLARSVRPGRVRIGLTNDLAYEVVARLERDAPRDDAFTAADAAAFGPFREMFPHQMLSPSQLVAISDVALLLLRVPGALERYPRDEAGVDAALIEATEVLRESAELEGGGLQRLQGDGAVAVFSDRVAAARAALRVAERTTGLALALHAGVARAADGGGGVQYFGRAVHFAEHLGRLAEAHELVVSETLLANPAVHRLLSERMTTLGSVNAADGIAFRLTLRRE